MNTRYLPLFVYGTLQPDTEGYQALLQGSVVEHAPAFWKNASLYLHPAFPLAIHSRGGTGVYGQILLIDAADFQNIIEELDEYEGYVGEGRLDNLYLRSTAKVEVFPTLPPDIADDSPGLETPHQWSGPTQEVICYAYVATPETIEEQRDRLILSPSGRWNAPGESWAELTESWEDSEEIDERFVD